MRALIILFLSFLCFSMKAQINNLPSFEKIDGVTKAVMNPKLYPLLLKVHLSTNTTNTEDFKNLITNLNHFEVYSADQKDSGQDLFKQMDSFVNVNSYTKLNDTTYELVNGEQKEYIVLKQNSAEVPVLYAFTTKLDYSGIENFSLM